MEPIFHRKFQRFVKRVKSQKLFQKIKAEVELIIKKPNKGQILEHPFRKYKIHCLNFDYKSNSYRIAYFINLKEKEIVFLLIDVRENFYEKLRRVL